jgi:hypothetical protein
MTPEQRHDPGLPDWARRERQGDLVWISENLDVFWPIAQVAFVDAGRGAIVVDMTSQPGGKSKGHPFGYFPQAVVETGDDEDIKRMVRAYDPAQELVIMLMKSENRTSTYRVGTRPRRQ